MQMDSEKQCKPVRLYCKSYVPKSLDPGLNPIILLHGWAASHSTWNKVMEEIGNRTRRKVYAVDLRNHADSEWSENNTVLDYTADIENFMQENDIKRCIFLGHSYGGRISMFIALTKPHLVEKVISGEMLLSSLSKENVKIGLEFINLGKKIRKLPGGLREKDVRGIIDKFTLEKYPKHECVTNSIPLKKNPDGSFDFYFNIEVLEKTLEDGTGYEIDFEKCQKFTGEVLLLYAANTIFRFEKDEKFKEFFPNAELHISTSSAHALHLDKRDEFLTTVINFINK